jgi:hypothetical protein
MLALLTALASSSFDGTAEPESRIRHLECFSIVRIFEHEIRQKRAPADIVADLSTQCTRLQGERKGVCLELLNKSASQIESLLGEQKRPDQICEEIGYARSFTPGYAVSRALCEEIVEHVRGHQGGARYRLPWKSRFGARDSKEESDRDVRRPRVENEDSEWERHARGHLSSFRHVFQERFGARRLCRDVRGQLRAVCETITGFVMHGMNEELAREANSTAICDELAGRHLLSFDDTPKKEG